MIMQFKKNWSVVAVMFFALTSLAENAMVEYRMRVQIDSSFAQYFDDPMYDIELSRDITNGEGKIEALTDVVRVPFSELRPFLAHFKVSKPEYLTGKVFSSPREKHDEAFELLRMKAMHVGKYNPPTKEEFFDILAQGLVDAAQSQGECPNLKYMVDRTSVFQHLKSVGRCQGIDDNFLNDFNHRIQKLSHGELSITIAESKKIEGIVPYRCPGEFFYLNKKGSQLPVVKFNIAGGSNGFVCTKDKKAIKAHTGWWDPDSFNESLQNQ